MKLYSENKDYKLYQGSMLDMLEVIEPNTIDSIVCDPPYELNFMGKGWDNSGIAFQPDTWKKCYEVLKPGGYLLAFGGSRTFHRIACAIEDAGFEIRDTIMWLYGSGFPKSMDISKSLDKRAESNDSVIEEKQQLGKWLKEKRGNRPQKEISKYFPSKTGGLTGCVANWEKGYNLPTWEIWVKLKDILDLDDRYDYLIEDRPNNFIEAEREVIGKMQNPASSIYSMGKNKMSRDVNITIPSTDLAKQWQGWGTALKPSFEPIIVARKPFKGSLVDNVIEYGVGGINIDECRVGMQEQDKEEYYKKRKSFENTNKKINIYGGNSFNSSSTTFYDIDTLTENTLNNGRFPANTILTYDETDFDEVCGGFPNTNGGNYRKVARKRTGFKISGSENNIQEANSPDNYGDSGSASRYFYCAKASKKDRDEGLDEFDDKYMAFSNQAKAELKRGNIDFKGNEDNPMNFVNSVSVRKNTHPTVKPTDLMQYLVRLVSPDGATILDPFNGSGSTGKAVMYENKEHNKNYKYIGIELTEEYLPIAKARIEYVCNLIEEEKTKDKQLTIFDIGGDNNE